MKNKLKFIVLLVLLFTTGCTVDYDLKINNDLSIEESFIAFDTKENLKEKKYNSFNDMIEANERLTIVDTDLYIINNYKKDNLLGATVKRKYTSLEEYVNQVNKYDLFLNKTTYTLSSDIATIKFSPVYEENKEFANIFYNIDANINIYIPFEVKEHNADSFDESKNIYTWNVKNYTKNNEELYVSFDTTKRNYSLGNYTSILIPILLGTVVLMIFLKIKSKANDRI